MAVSIDTVYQRVLAFANKEQRGYITPQEFNLFANQAQQEIFEQYFYDINQFARVPGNDTDYADVDEMLEAKLQIFEVSHGTAVTSNYTGAGGGGINKVLPNEVYRVHRVEFNNVNCEILDTKHFNEVRAGGPLTRPTNARPVANIRGNIIRCVAADNTLVTLTGLIFSRIPTPVRWGYVVVNEKALYDPTPGRTVHFELHQSEESELVYKILKFAGVAMQRVDVMRAGQIQEQSQVQNEKL
tara:strand:- start:2765 stop:3490 length:726 start_codon:yes stop_codon:yes gene_type:complete